MKAHIESTNSWVDLGPDSAAGLRRAARLLCKGVYRHIVLDRPVPTAWWAAGAPIAFGDLVEADLLYRETRLGDRRDSDNYAVIYTVVRNVTFVDMYGDTWFFGKSERWEK